MPDFNKYSNYSEKTSFSGVVIGAQAPILEVELNEIQQIFNTKLNRLSQFLGNTIISDSSGVVFNPETKGLTLTNCTAIAGSFTAFIPSSSITLTEEAPTAYLRLEERTVTGDAVLHEYGLLNSDTEVANTIVDPRVGVETSRRKVIEVALMNGSVFPETTDPDTYQIIPVGVMRRVDSESGVTYTFDKAKSSGSINEMLDDIRASVQALIESSSVRRMDLTIPADGWVQEGTGRYSYYRDIPMESVTDTMIPNLIVLEAGDEAALNCGLCPRAETLDGVLRVFASSIPSTDIPVSLTLQGSTTSSFPTSGGSSGGSLPIATSITPGAVKPGDGLNIAADGTLSIDRNKVLSDADLVNEEEVMESVVSILNEGAT